MTLEQLFKGEEKILGKCLSDLAAGRSATHIRKHLSKPVMAVLETNAGQSMDAGYVSYLVQYEWEQTNHQLRKK